MIVNKNSQPEEIDELEIIESIEKINKLDFELTGMESKIDEFEKIVDGFTTSTNDAVNTFKQSDTLTNIELQKIKNITEELEESVSKLDSDYSNLKYFALFSGLMAIIFMILSLALIFYILTNTSQ